MGGEKHIANFNDENGQGSPPRGRGKVPDTLLRSVANGITPAWAGKRKQKDKMVQNEKDHPRVGGEKPNVL